MQGLTVRSPAKINLFLNVTGKRPDGYHELESIFQTVSLSDTIEFKETRRGISIATDHPNLLTDRSNLIYQAADLIKRTYRVKQGLRMFLHKRIPIGGGLGGGSSNAAATLKALNQLWHLGISLDELARLGAQLGSDVPFFIYGGTALVKGRGEIVFPLQINCQPHYLLVCPDILVPTKNIYQNLKKYLTKPSYYVSEIINELIRGDINKTRGFLHNSLEPIALRLYPKLKSVYKQLKEASPEGVLLSGSGSSIFVMCSSKKEVKQLANRLHSNLLKSKEKSFGKILSIKYIPA